MLAIMMGKSNKVEFLSPLCFLFLILIWGNHKARSGGDQKAPEMAVFYTESCHACWNLELYIY